LQLDTGFSCNSIIWLTSLPESELGPTRRMVESMEALAGETPIGFQYIQVHSAEHLMKLLGELTTHASERGMLPLLNFDMHGSKDDGLRISETSEYVPWAVLSQTLQGLNKATGNNLVVVGAACFGLRAIMPIKLDEPSPFFVLLAPEAEVKVGFLEENIPRFYRDLLASGTLDSAYARYLSDKFKYFHCEKILFIVIAKYIQAGCKGKSARKRREQLLTDVFSQGMDKLQENMKMVRNKIKQGLKPNQELLDRYARVFLINRSCSFNMDQLLEVLNHE